MWDAFCKTDSMSLIETNHHTVPYFDSRGQQSSAVVCAFGRLWDWRLTRRQKCKDLAIEEATVTFLQWESTRDVSRSCCFRIIWRQRRETVLFFDARGSSSEPGCAGRRSQRQFQIHRVRHDVVARVASFIPSVSRQERHTSHKNLYTLRKRKKWKPSVIAHRTHHRNSSLTLLFEDLRQF